MKIKGLNRIIPGGGNIQTQGGLILYIVDGVTYLNNLSLSSFPLWFSSCPFSDKIYVETRDPWHVYEVVNLESRIISLMYSDEDRIELTPYEHSYIRSSYSQGNYLHEFIKEGETLWSFATTARYVTCLSNYALLWEGLYSRNKCQLISIETGMLLWELDHPGAYIKQVYSYEDKVIIVWFPPHGEEDRSRVLCVEVPSGKIIWENREPRYYQKYGNDKLVFFYSSLWEDGYERGDNHQLAELDARTGAFQMYKFPGYNTSTYVTTVYKDYLFYGTLNYYFYVGAIDLRTHEMLPEVKIDYTPGDFNQIASIGVHDGQFYVEIQTELDHSDIHVLDLDEDD